MCVGAEKRFSGQAQCHLMLITWPSCTTFRLLKTGRRGRRPSPGWVRGLPSLRPRLCLTQPRKSGRVGHDRSRTRGSANAARDRSSAGCQVIPVGAPSSAPHLSRRGWAASFVPSAGACRPGASSEAHRGRQVRPAARRGRPQAAHTVRDESLVIARPIDDSRRQDQTGGLPFSCWALRRECSVTVYVVHDQVLKPVVVIDLRIPYVSQGRSSWQALPPSAGRRTARS